MSDEIDQVEKAVRELARMPVVNPYAKGDETKPGPCWLFFGIESATCPLEHAVEFLVKRGFTEEQAKAGIDRHRNAGRITTQIQPPGSASAMLLHTTPLWLNWVNQKPAAIPLSVDLVACQVVVDGKGYSIQPHHAQMLDALVKAAERGDWWITGPELNELTACKGKKIYREFKNLTSKIPSLKRHIESGGPKGYRLKL